MSIKYNECNNRIYNELNKLSLDNYVCLAQFLIESTSSLIRHPSDYLFDFYNRQARKHIFTFNLFCGQLTNTITCTSINETLYNTLKQWAS